MFGTGIILLLYLLFAGLAARFKSTPNLVANHDAGEP
jgi:hypothetical protein